MRKLNLTRLGDIFTFKNGRAFKKSEWSEEGLPIIRIKNLNDSNAPFNYYEGQYDSAIEVNRGDLLFSWSGTVGSSFGSHIWGRDKGVLNQHIFKVGFKEAINLQYAYYALAEITAEIEKSVKGAVGLVHVTKSSLNEFQIPLPPLAEQERIVSILDKAFEGIDQAIAHTEQNLASARELFESYLNTIFNQKGEGWVETTIGDLGKVSMCKRILKKETKPNGDIPFYKIGTFGKAANAYISADLYNDFREKYSFPKKGEILISASGTIGRRVVYDGEPAYFQDSNIVWIANDETKVTNDYLYEFYGACDWNPSKGATISRLYNDDLRRIKIHFPESQRTQSSIVAEIRSLRINTQQLQSLYTQKLNDLKELKQSLLQQAFAGELTKEDAA